MQNKNSISVTDAYSQALTFAKTHYENFPVVSLLIPKRLKKHIAIVYWFARTADDIADEGNVSEKIRLEKLNEFEDEFKNSLEGNSSNGYEIALSNTITERKLTPKYFTDLLSAFKQDVTKRRYANFDEVLNYCKRSANPVGRIILELFDIRNEKANEYSDKICTALQLTNFLQDTIIDYKKGRIYLAKDEMQNFGVTDFLFEQKENNYNFKRLVKHNVERIYGFFDEGKNLLTFLNGKLRAEINWTILGGEEILLQIKKNDFDILNHRPELSKIKMAGLLINSFIS
ncbi:MAG: squalene synthase HpnC [Ignavibacterium sp.]|nr:MAG: squalene synthase HpnC [Ignavibacterium sp.]